MFLFVFVVLCDPLRGIIRTREVFFRRAERFICCREWGVVIVLLGIYLLAAIIVGVAVRSKYSGALVNKNWHKKTVRSRSLTRASQFGTRGVTN